MDSTMVAVKIPDEIWRKIDSPPIDIGTPQTTTEWAQYADRLRCALAEALFARHQSGRAGAGEALIEALAKIMPIRFDNGPDYMSLYFGSETHSTQAMTMHPQDWYDLQTAYEAALSQGTAGEDGT